MCTLFFACAKMGWDGVAMILPLIFVLLFDFFLYLILHYWIFDTMLLDFLCFTT